MYEHVNTVLGIVIVFFFFLISDPLQRKFTIELKCR